MPLHYAVDAIDLITHVAAEASVLLIVLPNEYESAIWCWALQKTLPVLVHEIFEAKVDILVVELLLHIVPHLKIS